MKKDLHPIDYRLVVFQDTSSKFSFLTRSTAPTNETVKWEDGNEYPLIKVHVSSASHPFFTGEEKIMDIEGRVDKFKARAEAAEKARQAKLASATKDVKKPTTKKKATEKPEVTEEISVTEPASEEAVIDTEK